MEPENESLEATTANPLAKLRAQVGLPSGLPVAVPCGRGPPLPAGLKAPLPVMTARCAGVAGICSGGPNLAASRLPPLLRRWTACSGWGCWCRTCWTTWLAPWSGLG